MNNLEIGIIAAATVAGPILAVQAQKWIERAGERRRSRRAIFHALMSNRATRLNDDFVKALNLIDLEFSPRKFGGMKDRAVIDAWRALFGEYHASPADGATQDEMRSWNERISERIVSLLFTMSKALRYDFSEEQLSSTLPISGSVTKRIRESPQERGGNFHISPVMPGHR